MGLAEKATLYAPPPSAWQLELDELELDELELDELGLEELELGELELEELELATKKLIAGVATPVGPVLL